MYKRCKIVLFGLPNLLLIIRVFLGFYLSFFGKVEGSFFLFVVVVIVFLVETKRKWEARRQPNKKEQKMFL